MTKASTAIVPRATISQICAHRAIALEKYSAAWEALAETNRAIGAALGEARKAAPMTNSYNYHQRDSKPSFLGPIEIPERDAFMNQAQRFIDTDIWAHLVDMTDLNKLMDKKAKDQFRQQLIDNPPEATIENVFATMTQLAADADMIFKRGVAECFSNLDRRFRSHDGWKIGSRVILSYAFDENGWWSHRRNHRDTLQDIERAFHVLDKKDDEAEGEEKPEPEIYQGIIGAVDRARQGQWGARQTEVETDFFLLRVYKNGNAHLWFKRDDLLAKVNQLLGDYYGAPIPEERDAEDDGGLNNPKTTPARYFGFYPTPERAAETVLDAAKLYRGKDAPPLTILEPSAGTGNLARPAALKGHIVDCVEIQPDHANGLALAGIYRKVLNVDFLAMRPSPDRLYDRIIMNPPFDRERDIDHVMHALKFLTPDGLLVAIMSAGTEVRDTRKSEAFRSLMKDMGAGWRDLPPRTFSEVGTNCNTIILSVRKSGGGYHFG